MLDPKRWPNGDDILERALARPAGERRAFVRGASAGDEDLLATLEAILDEAENEDEFLAVGGAMAGAVADDLAKQSEADGARQPRLQRGARFGAYEVKESLGHGGMGEVYRARDSRLGRDVALKVLPLDVAADPESLARFEREARLLASVNHPHIAAIYDVEVHDGVSALVLELVEGLTLAQRLKRGPFAIDEAIEVAFEIADALQAAHRRGIVHRDLKPANIKLSASGDVKVLDFGIAKALGSDSTSARIDADAPTIAATAGVRPGGILGTAPYVSPEHARGQATDHRADIWAYGCVLYEMLTGGRAFSGSSATEVIARVLERDPDWKQLPRQTPPALRRLLDRTFRKDPDRRLGHIGDALLDLEDARAELAQPRAEEAKPAGTAMAYGIGAVALAVGALAGAFAVSSMSTSETPPLVSFLSVPVPDADNLIAGELPGVAISPDGRTIVYRAWRDGVIQLIRRSLDGTEAEPIPGSESGASPFFSPDGLWVGFTSEAELMKIPVEGGTALRLSDAPGGARGSWAPDDTIYFSTGARRQIYRVPATGGDPVQVTTLDDDAGHLSYDTPFVLADGRSALVTILKANQQSVGVADLESGVVVELTEGQQPRYLPSGHIVLVRGNEIWAAAFDASARTLLSDPIVMVEGIELGNLNGTAHFALADDGSLVYMPARPTLGLRTPVWVSRDGTETPVVIEARNYSRVSLSPDGTRIALTQSDAGNSDIWTYDLPPRGTFGRLTSNPATDTAPIWSPDGLRIAFRSERDGGGVFVAPSDGAADAVRITRSDGASRPAHTPYAFTPDGRWLLFTELRSYSDQGIARALTDGSAEHELIIDDPLYAETRPALSPSGEWVAYQSDETGRYEVYLRSFPDVSAHKLTVSTSGGTSPRWSRDGSAIYFHDGNDLVLARVETGSTVAVHPPETIFEASRFNERLGPLYDVAPDGERFLFLSQSRPDGSLERRTDLRLVQHFVEQIKERVGR